MFYASAAKGFRPGGAQAQLSPVACAADFARLGITETPPTFNSDSLWSYEAGLKTRLLDNRLQFDGSAYLIEWKDIQQPVTIPSCSGNFTGNLGSVTSRGFDIAAQFRPVSALTLGVAVGYVKADYDETVYAVPPAVIRREGSRINVRPFSMTASAEYEFTLRGMDAYTRADFQYGARGPEFTPGDNGYDPLANRLVPLENLILRAGVRRGGVDLSVFADNATNAHPVTFNRGNANNGIFTAVPTRPRVVGISASYRY